MGICSDPVSADPLNLGNLQQNYLQLNQMQLLFLQFTALHFAAGDLQQVICSKIGHLQQNRTGSHRFDWYLGPPLFAKPRDTITWARPKNERQHRVAEKIPDFFVKKFFFSIFF